MAHVLRKIEDVLGSEESRWPKHGLPSWRDFEENRVTKDKDNFVKAIEMLDRSGQLLLLGALDSGKSFLAWSLGNHFRKSRVVWYGKADEIDYSDTLLLMQRVKNHLFIIEDCHKRQTEIDKLVGDMRDFGATSWLVLTAREVFGTAGRLGSFEEEPYLNLADSAGLTIRPNLEHIKGIIQNYIDHICSEYGPSDYTKVSHDQLEQLAVRNGPNLRYLMMRLRQWDHRNEDISKLSEKDEPILELIYLRYLDQPTERAVVLPIAVMNQFELDVSKTYLESKGDFSDLLAKGLISIKTYQHSFPPGDYISLLEQKESIDILRTAKAKWILPRQTREIDDYTREILVDYVTAEPPNYIELWGVLPEALKLTLVGHDEVLETLKHLIENEPLDRFSYFLFCARTAQNESRLLWKHYYTKNEDQILEAINEANSFTLNVLLSNRLLFTIEERPILLNALKVPRLTMRIAKSSWHSKVNILNILWSIGQREKVKQILLSPEFNPESMGLEAKNGTPQGLLWFLRVTIGIKEYDTGKFLRKVDAENMAAMAKHSGLSTIYSLADKAKRVDKPWAERFIEGFGSAELADKVTNATAMDMYRILTHLTYSIKKRDPRDFLESISSDALNKMIESSTLSALSLLIYKLQRHPYLHAWYRQFVTRLASTDLKTQFNKASVRTIGRFLWKVLQVDCNAANKLSKILLDKDVVAIHGNGNLKLREINNLIGNLEQIDEQCASDIAQQFIVKIIRQNSLERALLAEILLRSTVSDIEWLLWKTLCIAPEMSAREIFYILDKEDWDEISKQGSSLDAYRPKIRQNCIV